MNEGFHRGAREGGADHPGRVAGAPRSPRAPGGWRPRCRAPRSRGVAPPTRQRARRWRWVPSALPWRVLSRTLSTPSDGRKRACGQCGASQVAGGRVSFRFQDLEAALTFKIGVFFNSGTRCRLSK